MPTLYEVNGESHIKDPDEPGKVAFCGTSFEDSEIDSIQSYAMYLESIPFTGTWCDECYATALD